MAYTGLVYYGGSDSNPSSIDQANAVDKGQLHDFHYLKKAIIQKQKDLFFTPLANVTNMPKSFGKTIKVHEYLPLLDDRNINDQGIDASGQAVSGGYAYEIRVADLTIDDKSGTTTLTALTAAINAVMGTKGTATAGTGDGKIVIANIGTTITDGNGYATQAQVDDIITEATTAGVLDQFTFLPRVGNLYGSAKDVGTIGARLPAITEAGGRKHRVGFTRITRQANLTRYGFFYEFTDESLDFDTDAQLKDHLARELMNGAVETYEAQLQQDLIEAGTTRIYTGSATQRSEVATQVTYNDLLVLDEQLTLNRTPKQTTILTGSRNIDTRTIPASRILFVGPEIASKLRNMTDSGSNSVFVGIQHYAGQTTPLNGEIGSIDAFRIVMVPDMQFWEGEGHTTAPNMRVGYAIGSTNVAANVYPMMVVGEDSFTTIGFNTNNGRGGKFNVITKMPGAASADVYNNPYGTVGFSSIQWFYGCLILRPERIGMIETAVAA